MYVPLFFERDGEQDGMKGETEPVGRAQLDRSVLSYRASLVLYWFAAVFPRWLVREALASALKNSAT